jgi:two-component system, LytTR family, response regulator
MEKIITLPCTRGVYKCTSNDILYLEAQSNYTVIHFTNGTKYLLSKTMKQISLSLPSEYFYRLHNSFYVNLQYIKQIKIAATDSTAILVNNKVIPISRSKKPAVRKLIYNPEFSRLSRAL